MYFTGIQLQEASAAVLPGNWMFSEKDDAASSKTTKEGPTEILWDYVWVQLVPWPPVSMEAFNTGNSSAWDLRRVLLALLWMEMDLSL